MAKELTEKHLRKEIVTICRRISAMGYTCATEGNISAKINDTKILITPTNTNKSLVREGDIITVDKNGLQLSGNMKPSSEIALHIKIYSIRRDVKAIVHAHPPIATALTVAGIRLDKPLLPEVIITLGSIPTARYATPTTKLLAESVKQLVKYNDAILLERHGSVTVGRTLQEAYENLERLEWAAKVTFATLILGKPKHLSSQQIKELLKIRRHVFS